MRPARVSPQEATALMAAQRARGITPPKPVPLLPPKSRLRRRAVLVQRSRARFARAAWLGLRERVFARDNRTCLVCGATNPYGLNCHHVVFKSQRGPDAEWNLATVCAGPGLSGCHVRICHGSGSRSIRVLLQEKLAKMYPERYRRLLDGTLVLES